MKIKQSQLHQENTQRTEWPAELTPEQAREFMQEKIARLMAQAKHRYVEEDFDRN